MLINTYKISRLIKKSIVFWFAVFALGFFVGRAFAAEINIDTIIQLESSGNPNAYNSKDGDSGLMQITPILLAEWNIFHKTKVTQKDLFNADLNRRIGTWYLTKRIPQMLRAFKKPVTIENILICYNAGIAYVAKNRKLPEVTKRYIEKYKKMQKG